MDNGKTLELYKIYKAYLDQENTLLNQRTSWLATIQSFLTAALAILISKKYDLMLPANANNSTTDFPFDTYLILICLVGIFTSIFSGISTYAAKSAMEDIEANWKSLHLIEATQYGLPHIAGGGSKNAGKRGGHFAMAIPWIMGIFWLSIIILSLFETIHCLVVFKDWIAGLLAKCWIFQS